MLKFKMADHRNAATISDTPDPDIANNTATLSLKVQ
jgi:hypothetical protein